MQDTKEHQPHDKGYKRIFSVKKNFLDFIKKYVGFDWMLDLTVDDIELVNKEYVTDQFDTYESDLVYKIRLRGMSEETVESDESVEEVYIFFLQEMQSKNDFTMPFRLLVYMTAIWMDFFKNTDGKRRKRKDYRLPPIIPLVLYNGAPDWTAPLHFKDKVAHSDRFNGYVCDFEYILINVCKLDRGEIKKRNTLIDNILLADQFRTKEAWLENVKDLSDRVRKLSKEDQNLWKDWYEHAFQRVNQELKDKFMELFQNGDDNMCNSLEQLIMDQVEVGREEGIAVGREEGIAVGREEGIAEGIAEGIERASIASAQKMLLGNMEVSLIMEITNLEREKVEELRDELIQSGKLKE